MDDAVQALVEQLRDAKSAKRRSAAKRLRKLGDGAAGPALMAALEVELADARTWETQYQMIMALGHCGHAPALPRLCELARAGFAAAMVDSAVGDSIVRLARRHPHDAAALLDEIVPIGRQMLGMGGFRAVAMVRMVPPEEQLERMVRVLLEPATPENWRYWALAAAPGWTGPHAQRFLAEEERKGPYLTLVQAARKGQYARHDPL